MAMAPNAIPKAKMDRISDMLHVAVGPSAIAKRPAVIIRNTVPQSPAVTNVGRYVCIFSHVSTVPTAVDAVYMFPSRRAIDSSNNTPSPYPILSILYRQVPN